MGVAAASAISMSARQYKLLLGEKQKRTTLVQYQDRIGILLLASTQGGGHSNCHIQRTLGISYNTVKSWRKKWMLNYPKLLALEENKEEQISDKELLMSMLNILKDEQRSGCPRRISLAQEQQIVALACQKPIDFGVEMTTWTHELLAHVAMTKGIIDSISPRYVGMFLKKAANPTA